MKIDDRLEKLKQFDTPSITNVVATYPDKEYCLGLYHPWRGQCIRMSAQGLCIQS